MFVCVFWILMLVIDRKKNTSKRFLAFFFTFLLINFFAHAAYFNHKYELYTVLDSIWVLTSLLSFPFYYYYVRLLTTDTKIQFKWSLLALPSVLLAIYSAIIYVLMTPGEIEAYVQGVMYQKSGYEPYSKLVQLQVLRTYLVKIIFSVQVILSVYFGFKLIDNYNKKVRAFYSDIGGKDLTPMKWVLVAFIIASLISVVVGNIGKSFFISHPLLIFVPSIGFSACMFFSGYVGYMQRFTIEHFTRNVSEYESRKSYPEKRGAPDYIPNLNDQESLQDRLIYLLEKKEIFKNPELKLSDVSQLLKTNRTYVSRVVNEELNTNFCELVNSYRVNYAEKLLRISLQSNSLSIAEIAEQSGFSSESSFYRVFKNKKGISPGVYKQLKYNLVPVEN